MTEYETQMLTKMDALLEALARAFPEPRPYGHSGPNADTRTRQDAPPTPGSDNQSPPLWQHRNP